MIMLLIHTCDWTALLQLHSTFLLLLLILLVLFPTIIRYAYDGK